jgi:hypothetical protein
MAEKRHETRAPSDDPISQYAQSLVSAGTAHADEAARASLEQEPFHGYYFRILTGRPGNTAIGTESHVSGGKRKGGLAFVAYPAEYRSSGVMTFIIFVVGGVRVSDDFDPVALAHIVTPFA